MLPLSLIRAGLAMIAATLVGACNTAAGVGEDITGTARFLQSYIPYELQHGGGSYSGVPTLSGI